MESEFPSNSNEPKAATAKSKAAPDKKVKKIVTGKVIKRKKSWPKRFKESLVGDDSRTVLQSVLFDVVIPYSKDLVADAITQGVERKIFGESRSSSRRGRGYGFGNSRAHTAYNSMGGSATRDIFRREDPRQMSRRARATHNLDEIVLDTRAEATEVLDQLIELISNFDVATVADLYEMVDVTGEFTDEKFGWTDLRGSDITRVRDGYLLDLPRPQPLD